MGVRKHWNCTVPGCGEPHYSRGYCPNHWKRWRKYGDPLGYHESHSKFIPEINRFNAKVQKTESCWLWIGAKKATGYGNLHWGGQTRLAHRVSYEIAVGPIPDGMTIDHLCGNTSCVNPAHMEVVTFIENQRRRVVTPADRAAMAERIRPRQAAMIAARKAKASATH